jgi:tetratricopeptide (TPR) repeat protein
MPPHLCFPARLEEMAVLRHVLSVHPRDGHAHYYLGNLLYDKRQYDEAMRHWELACQLLPGFSIPWRNLGIACYNVRHDPDRAVEHYLKAFEVNRQDPRLLSELDQLLKRCGVPPAERLARLEAYLDLVEQRDDLTAERAALYNQLGQPQVALDILQSRRFHPWEGGEGRVSDHYVAAHLLLGQAALETGDAAGALAHLTATRSYPENLGEGRYPLAPEARVDYVIGLAEEALGKDEASKASFQRAADARAGFSPATYYQALALKKLDAGEAARERLQALLDYASGQLAAGMKAGFATSVPQFVFFESDPSRHHRIRYTYLVGLAQLGLGQAKLAEGAFLQVISLDVNHVGAQEALHKLATEA